ncbi:MAG TPA: helix-turn-helix domain-containing protein [Acidimicrobiia bacterium]
MSVEAMAMVLHHSQASGTDKVVLLGIANHEGDGGSWPAVATLAKYARCSERSVRYSLKRLVESGELVVVRQGGGSSEMRDDRRPNLYRVRVSCPPSCAGGTDHRERGEADCRPQVDGVKQASERGEAGFRDGVKPTAAEPSIEPSKNHQRKSSMTDSWQPDAANVERLKAKYPRLHLQDEIDKFRDHWISKGERRADWNAGLRTWMANADKWSKPSGFAPSGDYAAGSGGIYQ